MAEKKKYPWNKSILNLFRKRINRLENVGGVYAGPPPGDDDEPALTVYDGPPPGDDDEPVLTVYAGPPAGIRDRFRNRFSQLNNTGRVYAGPPPRDDDDDEPALAVYDGPPVEPGPGQEFPVFPEEEPVIDVYNGPPVDLFEEPEEPEEPEDPENSETLYEADPLGVYNGPAVPSDDKGIFSWNRGPLAPWEIAAPVYAGPEMMQERSSAIPPVPAPEIYTPETSDSEAPAPDQDAGNDQKNGPDGSASRGETGEAEKAQKAGSGAGNCEPMIKCPGCGFEYPESSRFCPECGTPNPGKR